MISVLQGRGAHCGRYCPFWSHEAAFLQEVAVFIVLAPPGYFFWQTKLDRLLLIGSLVLALAVELLDSGLKAIGDRTSEAHHKMAGRANDLGSAAVFGALLLAFLIWVMVFFLQIRRNRP